MDGFVEYCLTFDWLLTAAVKQRKLEWKREQYSMEDNHQINENEAVE